MHRIYPWKSREIRSIIDDIYNKIIDDILKARINRVLVLCSASGESVFEIARRLEARGLLGYEIIGLELDEDLVKIAEDKLRNLIFRGRIEFKCGDPSRILYPNEYFDAVIYESIVYPSPNPVDIAQVNISRVLRNGGYFILTDVLLFGDEEFYKSIGIKYYHKLKLEDFKRIMENSGFRNIVIDDITEIAKKAWKTKLENTKDEKLKQVINKLINEKLGVELKYIYVMGIKSKG